MSSKKCDGILPNKKICGAETFFSEATGEQCPRECAHCGHVINAFYDDSRVILRKDGPTISEFVDANMKAVDYPPEGFEAKHLSEEDKIRIDEMSEAESKYSDLLAEYKGLKTSYDKLVSEKKADKAAKVEVKTETKEEVKA